MYKQLKMIHFDAGKMESIVLDFTFKWILLVLTLFKLEILTFIHFYLPIFKFLLFR